MESNLRENLVSDDSKKTKTTLKKKLEEAFSSIEQEQKLIEEVKCGNKKRVFKILEEIFNEMKDSDLSINLIETRCLELTIMLSRVIIDGGVSLKHTLYLNNQLIKKMNQTNTLDEIFNLTKGFINSYVNLTGRRKNRKHLEIVQKVKDFICDNYAKNLTLDQVSDYVYLSSSHLSKIFKEVTGITIIEYLARIRLQEVKKLLRETEKPLREIAKLTGYYDASYLSKVFKQKESITPGQYRLNAKSV